MLQKLFLLLPLVLFAGPPSAEELECHATPSAGPRIKGGEGYFMTGSYLYWTGRETGLEFVVSGVENNQIEPTKRGEVFHPDFRYYSGFKFGLGVSLEHDNWDLYGQVTWIQPKASETVVDRDPGITDLRRTWFVGGDINTPFTPFHAKSRWKLQFQVVEVELGRNSFVSKYLSFRPHIGLKGTWQQQDYLVFYEAVNAVGLQRKERMHITQDSFGVGIRTGFDGAWHFNKYFSFIGNVAFSGLWSYFDTERTDRIEALLGPEFVRLKTENEYHTIQPVLEFSTGLRGEVWFFNSLYHLSLDLLWEEQRWYSMNKFYHILEETNHGSLVTQGLTLRLRFDF